MPSPEFNSLVTKNSPAPKPASTTPAFNNMVNSVRQQQAPMSFSQAYNYNRPPSIPNQPPVIKPPLMNSPTVTPPPVRPPVALAQRFATSKVPSAYDADLARLGDDYGSASSSSLSQAKPPALSPSFGQRLWQNFISPKSFLGAATKGAGGAVAGYLADQYIPKAEPNTSYVNDVVNNLRDTSINMGSGALGAGVRGAIAGGLFDLAGKAYTGVKDIGEIGSSLNDYWQNETQDRYRWSPGGNRFLRDANGVYQRDPTDPRLQKEGFDRGFIKAALEFSKKVKGGC